MARPREFDQEVVVDAAMHLFWRQGYRATSVQDLVQATGLQRGSLYGAFGDKHGLLIESLDAYAALSLREFDEAVLEAHDPVDALRDFIRMTGANCQDEEMGGRGCLMGNTCTELASHDEAVRVRVEDFVTRLRRSMTEVVRRGQIMGTFAVDRDPEAVAMFVQCSLQGVALFTKSRPDPQLIQSVIDELIRVLDQPQDTKP